MPLHDNGRLDCAFGGTGDGSPAAGSDAAAAAASAAAAAAAAAEGGSKGSGNGGSMRHVNVNYEPDLSYLRPAMQMVGVAVERVPGQQDQSTATTTTTALIVSVTVSVSDRTGVRRHMCQYAGSAAATAATVATAAAAAAGPWHWGLDIVGRAGAGAGMENESGRDSELSELGRWWHMLTGDGVEVTKYGQ